VPETIDNRTNYPFVLIVKQEPAPSPFAVLQQIGKVWTDNWIVGDPANNVGAALINAVDQEMIA